MTVNEVPFCGCTNEELEAGRTCGLPQCPNAKPPRPPRPPLVKARFAWDEEDVSFEGWHDPADRWNGFAVPGFERPEADRLAAWQTAEHAKDPEGYPSIAFDEARDAYIVDNRVSYPDEEDPTDAYSGGDFPCEDGVTRRLYHVGGWSWTWSEVATDDDGRPVLPATEAERVTIAEARVRDRLGSDLPIETANDLEAFLGDCLDLFGGGFHPDTPGADYVSYVGAGPATSTPTFSPGQAAAFDRNMAKAFEVGEAEYIDLYQWAFDRLDPDRRAEGERQERAYARASVPFDADLPGDALAALRRVWATRGDPEESAKLLAALDGWWGTDWTVTCVGDVDPEGKVLGTVDLTFRLDGGEAGVECEYAPCPYGPAAPGRWVASHGAHGDTYLCGGCLADREAERPRIGEPALP